MTHAAGHDIYIGKVKLPPLPKTLRHYTPPVEGGVDIEVDKKTPPIWQLADAEYRVTLDPKGVARYSNLYREPSKYTGTLEYHGPSNVGAIHMDSPTALSENIWGDATKEALGVVPGQLVRHGKSYQVTSNMGTGTLQEKRDRMHHEAFHDASILALNSEFMPKEFREAYKFLRQPGVGSRLGIQIDEALAYHDQLETASTPEYKKLAEVQLKKMRKSAMDKLLAAKRDKRNDAVGILSFWLEQLKPKNLTKWNNQILRAAQKRHEALGYK